MAKDTFNLKQFLIENKLTEQSRRQGMRVRFLKEGMESSRFDIAMPAGIEMDELDEESSKFVDPSELVDECDMQQPR